MKNLITRALTGAVFVAVLVSCIVWNPLSFGVLFTIITALSTWEFCKVMNQREDVEINPFITTTASVYLFLAFFCYNAGLLGGFLIFMPYLLTILYLLVSALYVGRQNALTTWAFTMLSQMYVALPFALLCQLSFLPVPGEPFSSIYLWILPLSVFIFLWANDTGAYCVGSLLGKKIPYRLFPSVSPKKSWVGSIGGGILVLIVAAIISYFDVTLTLVEWMGFGLVVVFFGTWGDLVESQMKRQLGIKDSGNILPGHGGMLDRFDSSLLAIPAALVYLYSIMLL